MPRDPLIPGLREYDAPRRRRRTPVFWGWLFGGIAVIVALVVAGGLVAGIGPLRALGTAETPLDPVAWRVALAAKGLDVTTAALNPQAWMATQVSYWEGPVTIAGSHPGTGYVEMTGY